MFLLWGVVGTSHNPHLEDHPLSVVRVFNTFAATWYFFTVRSCWHLAQTPAGGPPLVGCPLIQYNRSYPLYVRPFLLPPPKDAPCRCDRHQLITDNVCVLSVKDLRYYYLSLLSVLFLYLQLQPGKYHLSEGWPWHWANNSERRILLRQTAADFHNS